MSSPVDQGYSRIPLSDGCIYKMIIQEGIVSKQDYSEEQSTELALSKGQGTQSDHLEYPESDRPLLESVCTFTVERKYPASQTDTDSFTDKYVENLAEVPFQTKIKRTIGSPTSVFMVTIEKCLMTMLKGEVSSFAFDQELCFEMKPMYICLTLCEIEMSKPIWALSPKEKHNFALLHKETGKELFSLNPELAFYEFSLALKYLISMPTYHPLVFTQSGISQAEREEYEKLQCICHLNIAACQGQFDNHQSVIDNCTYALRLQPSNLKGLFRRCKAYLAEGNKDQARSDLLKMTKLAPKNPEVRTLLRQMKDG